MPLWLTLIAIGIVLAIVGFAGVGSLLIWIGVAILIVGAIMTLVSRSGSRV
jgi:membrane protein implicated in regulation of membrane protease activity